MNNVTFGILLRLLSGLLFAAMGICIKSLGPVPLGEVVFFRSIFALPPLLVFLWLRREFPYGLKTRRPMGHLIRSIFGAIAMFTSFAAIARLPIAEATLIGYLAPLLMAIFAALFLDERLTRLRILALGFCLAGVLVLVAPALGHGPQDATRIIGYGLCFLTAVLTAAALTMVRSLSQSESPGAIALYFALACTAAGLATLPSGWIVPEGRTLVLLIACGILGGMAHIAMTLAFRYAEAARLAPADYVSILWVGMADLLIFGLVPAATFPPALILVLTGAALPLIEARRQRGAVADGDRP